MAKLLNTFLLVSVILLCALGASSCSSPSSGVLLPTVQANQKLSDTQAKNDTVQQITSDAEIKVFGNWRRQTVGGAIVNYYLTFSVKNTGQREIKLNLSQLAVGGENVVNSKVGAVNVLSKPLETISNAGSNVSDSTIIISPQETKIFRADYTATENEKASGEKAVKYIIPAGIVGESQDVVFQFRCATDFEPLPNDSQRPTAN